MRGKKPREPWRGRSNLRWDMAQSAKREASGAKGERFYSDEIERPEKRFVQVEGCNGRCRVERELWEVGFQQRTAGRKRAWRGRLLLTMGPRRFLGHSAAGGRRVEHFHFMGAIPVPCRARLYSTATGTFRCSSGSAMRIGTRGGTVITSS